MDFSHEVGTIDWETVVVSTTTAFIAALVASLTAIRIARRQRRHDLEDRWAEIRADMLQQPLPGALEALRAQAAAGERSLAAARRQVESVARAASGLPNPERRKYVTPLARSVAELEALDRELASMPATGAHDTETDGAIEELDADYAEALAKLVEDLDRLDEHLQESSSAGQRRFRWIPRLRR